MDFLKPFSKMPYFLMHKIFDVTPVFINFIEQCWHLTILPSNFLLKYFNVCDVLEVACLVTRGKRGTH